jgi:hypothetical protein
VKHRELAVVLALVTASGACGSREDHAAGGAPVSPAVAVAKGDVRPLRGPDPIAKGVPHSAAIRGVGATEEGDAAITVDELGGMRLWPSLDGVRSPVPIVSPSPADQVALFHDGQDLIAVILDTAGGIALLRLGLDGVLHGRAEVFGDSPFVEIVAVGNQLLARTADHAVELYSADGDRIGRIVPPAGQRVTDLAARRGRAAAVLATEAGAAMSWISTGASLAWGTSMALPVTPREDMFALAPGKRRIAFVDAAGTGLQVFDLDFIPTPVVGPQVAVHVAHLSLGFVEDDVVAIAGSPTVWWAANPATTRDPWAVTTASPGTSTLAAALVDGRMIAAASASLALSNQERTRYLGWSDAAKNAAAQIGEAIVLTTNSREFTWLDRDLTATRTFDVTDAKTPDGQWSYGTPVGSHHIVMRYQQGDHTVLELVDAVPPHARTLIGRFAQLERHDAVDEMLAVVDGKTIRRYRLDLTATAVEELKPALQRPVASVMWVRLFDPDKANGLAGLVGGWASDYSEHAALYAYTRSGKKLVRSKLAPFDGQLVSSQPNGRSFAYDAVTQELLTMHGTEIEARTPLEARARPHAIDPAGNRFASRDEQDIVVRDARGAELWRATVWAANTLGFVADGTRLIVTAPGGLIAFDAGSGERIARECGWNFGLHDTLPETFGVAFTSVCEDSVVQ